MTPRSVAKAKGLLTYFTGRPCPHGHVAPRRTDNATCVICQAATNMRMRHSDPGYMTTYNKDHRGFEARRRYYAKHREKLRAYRRTMQWRYSAHTQTRMASKLRATPEWADHDIIRALHQIAFLYRKAGIPANVDHIVPLQSKIVCGLHCQANLTILPKLDNLRKSNRTWPDMPWIK
jgi:hypothetical protein